LTLSEKDVIISRFGWSFRRGARVAKGGRL
jgi:hypothetical protein